MKPKHLHIYERSARNIDVYRCISPTCSHFTQRELLIGKLAVCAKCKHEEFIIQMSQLRVNQKVPGNKLLVCTFCSKSPKAQVAKLAKTVAEDVLTELSFEEAMRGDMKQEPEEMIPYSLTIENIRKEDAS